MLRVIGAHYKSRDELAIPPDVCDITLSFFLKGGGGRRGVDFCPRESFRDNLSSRFISRRKGENDGGQFRGAPFSKKNVFEEENWTGMICFRKLITTIPPPPEFPGVYKMRDSICF